MSHPECGICEHQDKYPVAAQRRPTNVPSRPAKLWTRTLSSLSERDSEQGIATFQRPHSTSEHAVPQSSSPHTIPEDWRPVDPDSPRPLGSSTTSDLSEDLYPLDSPDLEPHSDGTDSIEPLTNPSPLGEKILRHQPTPWPGNLPLDSGTSSTTDATVKKPRACLHPILLRDVIMGFSDGLTVPFALTAGLSLLGSSRVVLTAGIAELCSGSISMGLGAYVAASTDRNTYRAAEKYVRALVQNEDEGLNVRIVGVLQKYGVSELAAAGVMQEMKEDEEGLVKFLLEVDLGLEKPARGGPWVECFVTAASYWIGGFLPMVPYMILSLSTKMAFQYSIGIGAFALLAFGFLKGRLSNLNTRGCFISSVQMFMVGAFATGASYGMIRLMQEMKMTKDLH